jgi:hypothetical protein
MTESESVALPLGDAPQRMILYHSVSYLSIPKLKNILKIPPACNLLYFVL